MKDNKHIKSFNEHQENLNISDVSDGFLSPEEFLIEWEGKDDSTHPNNDIRDEWTKRINQLKIYSKMAVENALKKHH